MRRIAAGVLIVVALGWSVSSPERPGSRLIRDAQRMECFERRRTQATVALGDSLTMGSSDPAWGFQADDSWFSLVTCDGSPRYGLNAGVGGETTADMRRRLDSVLGAEPELVIILAGTNDLLQHRPIDEAAADLTAMVEAIEASGAKVVVGTIPPLEGSLSESGTIAFARLGGR